MCAKIVSVNISEKKGTVKQPVSNILLTKLGIENDAHAGSWHRQVSLLSKESIESFASQENTAFKWGEFAENITTEGIDFKKISLLDRLIIDDAELEVTQIGKKCHGDGCAIFKEVGKCVMPKEGIFCRVITEGKIAVDSTITHIQNHLKISIITLSDRASRGEYSDRSGPQIRELLDAHFEKSHFSFECTYVIIPDDAQILKKELLNACDKNTDFIFTTGGTGLSSRDITPDVVKEMIDREIPGIMESIRVTFGAKFPNALLSRSIAGVIGKTIVYTLPGSVKAATEYTQEIVKTMDHAVFMIRDINNH